MLGPLATEPGLLGTVQGLSSHVSRVVWNQKAYGLAHFQECKGPSFWRPNNARSAIILGEGGKIAGSAWVKLLFAS